MQINVKHCKKRIIPPAAPHGALFLHSHQLMGVQKGSFIQMHEIVGNNNLLQFSAAGSSSPCAPSTHPKDCPPCSVRAGLAPEQPPDGHLSCPSSSSCWYQEGVAVLIWINPKMSPGFQGRSRCWGLLCEWLGCFHRGCCALSYLPEHMKCMQEY